MKKWFCLFVLFLLCGCSNGYTLNRSDETDKIKIYMLTDEKNVQVSNLSVEVQVCQENCLDILKAMENKYPDGWIVWGNKASQAFSSYENINEIPIIEVDQQDELTALKQYYPQYIWEKTDGFNFPEADAYYYMEDVPVSTDKPFYQSKNVNSICELEEDYELLIQQLNEQIENIKEGRKVHSVTLHWKLK